MSGAFITLPLRSHHQEPAPSPVSLRRPAAGLAVQVCPPCAAAADADTDYVAGGGRAWDTVIGKRCTIAGSTTRSPLALLVQSPSFIVTSACSRLLYSVP